MHLLSLSLSTPLSLTLSIIFAEILEDFERAFGICSNLNVSIFSLLFGGVLYLGAFLMVNLCTKESERDKRNRTWEKGGERIVIVVGKKLLVF